LLLVVCVLFFFFQAEDGIRDRNVTGVQTCALPISEVELKERKHRIEDAVRNAKAAVEEGIVAGGGVALVQAAAAAFEKLALEGDEATGADMVKAAAQAPLKQIAVNAGYEGGVVAERDLGLERSHCV